MSKLIMRINNLYHVQSTRIHYSFGINRNSFIVLIFPLINLAMDPRFAIQLLIGNGKRRISDFCSFYETESV